MKIFEKHRVKIKKIEMNLQGNQHQAGRDPAHVEPSAHNVQVPPRIPKIGNHALASNLMILDDMPSNIGDALLEC